jgi:P27 family predicted phage terminase small subunit
MPPKKPLQIIRFENKSKRSKKQLEDREDTEIKLGNNKLNLPTIVKKDKAALKKWEQLVSLYDEIEYVSSADSDILAQYCICHSELEFLINSKDTIVKNYKKLKKTTLQIVESLNKTNIDNLINKKREALQKMGSKIFLDPTARIKAIPLEKKEPPKADPLSSFGNI